MDLSLITDNNISHYVYIKYFNRFTCNKANLKKKKEFCRYCLQCFSKHEELVEHIKTCSEINGIQRVKL